MGTIWCYVNNPNDVNPNEIRPNVISPKDIRPNVMLDLIRHYTKIINGRHQTKCDVRPKSYVADIGPNVMFRFPEIPKYS